MPPTVPRTTRASNTRSTKARKRVTPVADLYATLREQIVANEVLPGEHLVESALSARFETNRNVIRAAFTQLETDGLIVREPNRGARVRIITATEARQIVDVRSALEALVSQRAAERLTPADAKALRGIIGEMRSSLKTQDYLNYTRLNATLHAAILEISRHTIAAKVLGQLHSQSVRSQYRAVFVPGRAGASLAEHEKIVDAIIARKPAAAAKAMRFHLTHVMQTIDELEKFGLH
jgi:DNA-binding GntR family transcriptional regulator